VAVGVQSGRADKPEPPEIQGGVGVGVQSGRAEALEPAELQGKGVAVVVTVGVSVWVGSGRGRGVAVGGLLAGGLGAQSGRPGKPQVGPAVSVGGQAPDAGSQLCARTPCGLPATPKDAITTAKKK